MGGGATPVAHGGSQARGPFGALVAGLHHSQSNSGSEPCLQPTPQLMAMPDPFFFFFFFCLFVFSVAVPVAHGDFQARGLIGAVATGLWQSHSTVESEPCLRPTP